MQPVELRREDWRRVADGLSRSEGGHATLFIAVLDVGLLSAAIALTAQRSALAWTAAVLLTSVALLHGYLLHHECVHRAVFRDDRLNHALGHLLGVVLLYPFLPRRKAHLFHHAWTGDAHGDPANRRAVARLSRLSSRALRVLDLLWRSWFPFLVLNERLGLWRASLGSRDGDPPSRAERRASLLYLSVYAACVALAALHEQLVRPLLVYVCALALLFWLEEIINLPHHLEAPLARRGQPVPLWQQYALSASCRSVPVWSRWLLLHFNLHTAHHLFPRLPWHALPRAQAELTKLGLEAGAEDELCWNWTQRRRPFAQAFAAYLRGQELGVDARTTVCSSRGHGAVSAVPRMFVRRRRPTE